MQKANLIGQTFGKLTVIAPGPPTGKRNRSTFLCQCSCGTSKTITAENLKDGSTKSCGCLKKELNQLRAPKMYSKCIKYHPNIATARRVFRNYNDGLMFDDFLRLSQQNCHYCGQPPSNKANDKKLDSKASLFAKENGDFIYNGLDRLDSSKNHSVYNVVPCCFVCNRAKNNMSYENFKDWIRRLVAHQKM
jgi:hypothetical protein